LVRVRVNRGTGIEIRCDDPRVPKDQSNTCWRVAERAVEALGVRGGVVIEIEKRLPVQGGLGGASSNAVAALLALEIAAKKRLSGEERLRIAAEVGSDLPLFLLGGSVLGCGRGEEVYPLPDLPAMPCVIAMPEVGVSTPQAFADWDLGLCGAGTLARERHEARSLPEETPAEQGSAWTGRSARPHTIKSKGKDKSKGKKDSGYNADSELTLVDPSDRMNLFSRRISAGLSSASGVPVGRGRGRAETPLLDLVRTGIGNDFELVVFPKYPELREAKSVLEGAGAFYASLSGSGSAVYGLFETRRKAETGAAALSKKDIPAVVTSTLTRSQYWKRLRIED
jgi:4-diphosphocytidyl-2-C-methyl-D-erythritol kinase